MQLFFASVDLAKKKQKKQSKNQHQRQPFGLWTLLPLGCLFLSFFFSKNGLYYLQKK
jgi:hypothetical protein